MEKRSLVTGAAGFVGGYLIEHLLGAGEAVLACDVSDEPAAGSGQRAMTIDVPWLRWDLARAAGLDREVRERIEHFAPEVIYHLAAISVPADCGGEEPTPEAVAVNVDGTRRVMELAGSLASRPRVVLISSSHVYAPVSTDAPVVDEASPVEPGGGYGKTKLAAEQVALAAGRELGRDAVIARAFQHTGPGQGPRMMLPEWASQFAAGGDEPVKVHTLGAQIDVSDVRDVVRAYRLLAEHGTPGGVYNVGSGTSRRSGDLLELLRRLAGPTRQIVEIRPGHKQDPIADVARLTQCTGWRPEIPIERTIGDTWEYWRGRASE